MNFSVLDLEGKRLAAGRDLQQLRRQLRTGTSTPARPAAVAAGLRREWDFGDVPAERQVERGGLRFTVYPAIRDAGEGVELVELDSAMLAEHETRKGVWRLLLLALAQQVRFARKRLADRNELALLAAVALPDVRIADRLADRVILDAFLPDEAATPRSRAQFDAAVAAGRDRFAQALDRIEARALEMLGELKNVRQKLRGLSCPACKAAVADVEQQLAGLFAREFLERTPQSRLTQYPRYLKALARRLDRLPAGVARDTELMRTVEPFIREWQGLRLAAGGPLRAELLPELSALRWMIEEFRVSLFAQDLRTAVPVSPQRMAAQLAKARVEATGNQ